MGKQSVDEIWASLKSSTMKKASEAMSGVRSAKAGLASGARREGKGDSDDAEGGIGSEASKQGVAEEKSLSELGDLSVEGVMAALRRDVNCLTDANRNTRRTGAERLRRRLLEDDKFAEKAGKAGEGGESLFPSLLTDALLVPMTRLLNDQAEKCREAALLFAKAAAEVLPNTSLLFQRTVPAVKARVGSDQVAEPSEELRLWMIQLLRGEMSKKCDKSHVQAYISEIVAVVVKGLDDPFHEVKKETCRLVEELPGIVANDALLLEHAESIVKGIVRNMAHPHNKVRVLLVSAVDALVGLRPDKSLVEKYVVTILHESMFDKAHQVRERMYDSIAGWLGMVGESSDAGDGPLVPIYAEILLPFYLVGLLDDEPRISESSRLKLESVCKANSEKGCYSQGAGKDGEAPTMAAAAAETLVRQMTTHHLKHITSICKRDLAEWTTNKNLSASRLLHKATEISKSDMEPYLDVVLPILCNAVGNENEDIAQYIVFSTHHIGASCSPDSWVCILLDSLNNPKSSVVQRANALVVLAGLVHGCSLSKKEIKEEMLASLATTLASEEIRGAGHYAINTQLLSVIINLLQAFGEQCRPVSQELYHVLLQLQALRNDEHLQGGAVEVTTKLAQVCGYDCAASFASDHSKDLIHILCGTCNEWTKESPDQFVFAALIFNCSIEVLSGLYEQITKVFASCLQQDRDPHIRLETLKLLDRLLEDQDRNGFVAQHSKAFLAEVLLPPAVWQVGKTAASIRFHAIVAIGTFFRQKLMNSAELAHVLMDDQMQLLPTIHSSLEEDYYADTRLSSCHTLEALLLVIGTKLTNDQKRLVYPELLKRLDDSTDKVRIQACVTLEAFVACLTSDYCETNTGYILKGVLIHMDDTNPAVQEAVCVVVEKLARIKPGVTRGCLHEVRDQHRGVAYIDRVLGMM
ncbi:hypothetical protein HOP50_06g44790 [Chloropicon primus]|uniref:Uncharacterized protein n=3 Tax=Chloropicon primus TaxID=1764295 RepID=A0A5B8MMQ0_9CHLO|nr:hypothetical protein A3770_06p44560 [Chloropicon primus]UPR01158.1 hypothetical protein HOP50_06g44790 [Chloropicon primus]|eukprot:QDZ21938.1 hypothetical protein A3770_06p44560 [Chloropicon primus]